MDENGIFNKCFQHEQIFYEIGVGDDININVTGMICSGRKATAEGKSSLIETFDQLIEARFR